MNAFVSLDGVRHTYGAANNSPAVENLSIEIAEGEFALENLLLPLEIVEPHRSEIRRQRSKYVARARELLSSVGLSDQGDKFPWELSGACSSELRCAGR